MTTDADDALIAKLLAEDTACGYQSSFEEYYSDDSDHGLSKRKKKAKKRGGCRTQMPPPKEGEAPGGTLEVTATGRRKRKDHGAARDPGKSWSDDEERLFLEALDLYGEVACHMSIKNKRWQLQPAWCLICDHDQQMGASNLTLPPC